MFLGQDLIKTCSKILVTESKLLLEGMKKVFPDILFLRIWFVNMSERCCLEERVAKDNNQNVPIIIKNMRMATKSR